MRRATLIAAAVAGALALAPGAADAYQLQSFGVGVTDPGTVANPTPEGDVPLLAAGEHPDVTVDMTFPEKTDPQRGQVPDESIKTANVSLPRGLIFNPTVATQCTQKELSEAYVAHCPLSSQVGVAYVAQPGYTQRVSIFNIVPPPGVPAQFGFNLVKTVVKINAEVHTGGDYGLSANARAISQALPLVGARLDFWGAPADPVHDSLRQTFLPPNDDVISGPANIATRSMISNPGRCDAGPMIFETQVASWENPALGPVQSALNERVGGAPLQVTGCESLPFDPSVRAAPTTSAPDSPTGLDVDVTVPQSDDPGVPSSAHLKDLSLLLPEGMNVNPSAADGLTACAPSEIALSSSASAACPASSSIGSVSIDTPLLDQPLVGRAYLAKQNDNPFNSTLAMYIATERDGAVVKLAGRIDPDPATGRLRVTFSNNPELPFRTLRVSLDGGSRAPLTTPATCGTKTLEGTATPWSGGAAKTVTSSFSIDCAAGLGGFAPGFDAGTQSPTAGLFSPLGVSFTRPDGQSALRDVTLDLPPGLLAKLRGVRECSSAEVAAAACGASSRVGGVKLTTGAGEKPFPIAGDVFLTGPYKGAPYGLAVRVRAVAGPLDLGTVVVRQALFIDPDSTQVRVVSDPLPTILSGIPIRLRALDINVDRPGFAVNPTSCSAKKATGRVGSASGQQVPVSVRFQVGSCASLPLKPKLNLRLIGSGGALRDGGHPALKAILTQGPRQSNLKRAEVKLPLSLALDPDNAQTLCEYAAGATSRPVCPKGSVVGRAKARSPLLGQTLAGPVYFVKGQRTDRRTGRIVKTLPTLVVPLEGDGVQINLRARTSVSGGRLVAAFDPIPDAPVSRFDLSIDGGRNGILVANSSVCSKSRTLGIGIRGQNGVLVRTAPSLAASCR